MKLRRIINSVRGQFGIVHVRLAIVQALMYCMPYNVLPQLRTELYRWAGFKDIGSHVRILDMIDLRGWGNLYKRLHIGNDSNINHHCHFDLMNHIYIGSMVDIGPDVKIMTSNHEPGTARRCGKFRSQPVRIGDGTWIQASAHIYSGVTVGRGAIIMPNAVVFRDVPENTQVGGNPARPVRTLDPLMAQPHTA